MCICIFFFPGNIHGVWNTLKLTTASLVAGIPLEAWIILREELEKVPLVKQTEIP